MFGKKRKEEERKKLDLIEKLMEYQGELINRVKIACEKSGEDYSPKVYKNGFDMIYSGVTFRTPNGLLVKYTDYIDYEQIQIFGPKFIRYRGTLSRDTIKKSFIIGELYLGEYGSPVYFPRLDKYKEKYATVFSGTEEELSMLQYLFEETKILESTKETSKINNNDDDDIHKGFGSM